MKPLHFTREQITKILKQIAKEEGGLNRLLTMSLKALMRAERSEHNSIEQRCK